MTTRSALDRATMDTTAKMLLLLTLLGSLTHQVVVSSTVGDDQDHYGIMVDAGSSSSKIKLYKWTPPKTAASMPRIVLADNGKFKKPISGFTNDPEGLSDYVDEMLDWAVLRIPESKQSTTPILIQATAGMRFLDSEITYELLTEVRDILNNGSRNPFAPITHNDVSVISGEEEGVYAWIAANYLLGFFEGNKPVNESVGILEMGGGSTQIAFIPEGPLYDGEFQVRLANRRYSIYVHSYLNMGANGMNREIAHYVKSETGSSPDHIMEPCMLRGDNKTMNLGNDMSLKVFGDGNATRCQDIISELMRPDEGINCQPKPCVIREVYQPSIGKGRFYATQAFTYAPKTLDAVRKDGTLDLQQLMDSAQDFCDMSWEEAAEEHPNRTKAYLSSDCMQGNYIPTLFQNYGFHLDTEQITLTSKINSEKIDWALGSMLMKLSDRFATKRGHFSVLCPTRGKPDNAGGSAGLVRSNGIQKAAAIVVSLCLLLVNIRLW